MHGKESPVLVLEIDTRSEKEVENDRLRDIARHSERMVGGKKPCPKKMLEEYSGPMIERGPDMVLYEHMEDGPGSSLFDPSSAGRYAKAMGVSDEELNMIRQMVAAEMGEDGMPASLSRFKQDYAEMKKYGGDPIAMELARQDDRMQADMDDMLRMSMDGMSMSDPVSAAMSAMEEQFGRDVASVMEGEADGYVVFSVDSPEMGQVKYIYDSKDGIGRVLRG